MEFPDLGKHCSVATCSRLDFLPYECDACHKIFCKDHGPYEKHNCEESYAKDSRVPVCPLCNQPVPTGKGEDPNIKVDTHIQNECKSEKAKKLSNRCAVPGCKKKELVPVTCNTCRKNFCIKHRFETDHNCQGDPRRLEGRASASNRSGSSPASSKGGGGGGQNKASGRTRASGTPQKTALSSIGADLNRERMMRLQSRQGSSSQPSSSSAQLQPNIGEDEAMARAIAASIGESSPLPPSSSSSTSQPSHLPAAPHHTPQTSSTIPPTIDEDEDLARAIAASLNDKDQPKPKPKTTSGTGRQTSKSSGSDSCTIS